MALARNALLCVNSEVLELSFPVLGRLRGLRDGKVPAALRWNPGFSSETDVVACLRAGIESHCSDARDKVFAVLSLMEPRAKAFIPVDYSLDLNAIYTNALLGVVAASGSLEVLSHALTVRPSRIDDDQVRPTVNLTLFEIYVSSNQPVVFKSIPFCSSQRLSKSASSIWRPRATIKTTPILDAFVDTCNDPEESVVLFEKRCTVAPDCLLPRFQTRAQFVDIIDWHQQHKGLACRRLSDFAEDFKFKNCPRFFPFFSRTPHPQSPFFALHSGVKPDETVTESNSPNVNVPDLQIFMETLKGTEDDRKLFTTHYSIGHAQGDVRGGDAVFVLDGARFPFILRRVGPKEYKTVTVCYLWAALELDYWVPGTQKGLWGSRHHDHACEQTQTIVIH